MALARQVEDQLLTVEICEDLDERNVKTKPRARRVGRRHERAAAWRSHRRRPVLVARLHGARMGPYVDPHLAYWRPAGRAAPAGRLCGPQFSPRVSAVGEATRRRRACFLQRLSAPWQ